MHGPVSAHREAVGAAPGTALRHGLVILLAVLVLRGPVLSLSAIDWDETAYALVAREILAGHWPYQAVFDHKPVALYLHFAAAMAVAGDSPVVTRGLGLVMVALGALLLRAMLVRTLAVPAGASLAVALGYVVASGGLGGAATNTELFVNVYLLLAVASAIQADRRHAGYFVVSGALGAVAFHVNYIAALPLAGLLLGYAAFALARAGTAGAAAGRVARAFLLGLGGFAAASLLLLAPILLFGDIRQYFGLQYAFLRGYASETGLIEMARRAMPTARLFLPLLAMTACLLWMVDRQLRLRNRPANAGAPGEAARRFRSYVALFSGLLLGAAAAVSASGHFFPHYFLLLLPPLGLLLGLALGYAGALRPAVPLALTVFLAVAVVIGVRGLAATVHGTVTLLDMLAGREPTLDAPRTVARQLAPRLAPGETAYVLCAKPVLYQLLGVSPPTRFPMYGDALDPAVAGRFGYTVESALEDALGNDAVAFVIQGRMRSCEATFDYLEARGYDFAERLEDHGFELRDEIRGHRIYGR